MSTTYEHIDAPGAVYFKNICRGTVGPPSTVYYPFHGIYISLDYTFTTFGLRIPEGMTVQLIDNKITVSGVGNTGPVQATIHFKAWGRAATMISRTLHSAPSVPRQIPSAPSKVGQ
jgi:hypothetical protein